MDDVNNCQIPEKIILNGDMHWQVGVERDLTEKVVGLSRYPRANENGQRLINVCMDKNLYCQYIIQAYKNSHVY